MFKLDVCRTRVILKEKEGIWRECKTSVQEEGFIGLFVGIYPRISRSIISGAIQFGSYEVSKNLLM